MSEEMKQNIFVYFIDQRAHVKIGISNDPRRRMRELQVGNPHPLHLLGAFRCPDEETAREFEAILHNIFGHLLIGGEWFDLSDPVHHSRPRVLWLHFLEQIIIGLEQVTKAWYAASTKTADNADSDGPLGGTR